MIWIKSHWKLLLTIIIGLLIALWILSVTGMNKELYNMMLNQLREDKTAVVEGLKKELDITKQEKAKIKEEQIALAKEKEQWRQRSLREAEENTKLKGEVNVLKTKLSQIVVSDDPKKIIDDLHRSGIKSIRLKEK